MLWLRSHFNCDIYAEHSSFYQLIKFDDLPRRQHFLYSVADVLCSDHSIEHFQDVQRQLGHQVVSKNYSTLHFTVPISKVRYYSSYKGFPDSAKAAPKMTTSTSSYNPLMCPPQPSFWSALFGQNQPQNGPVCTCKQNRGYTSFFYQYNGYSCTCGCPCVKCSGERSSYVGGCGSDQSLPSAVLYEGAPTIALAHPGTSDEDEYSPPFRNTPRSRRQYNSTRELGPRILLRITKKPNPRLTTILRPPLPESKLSRVTVKIMDLQGDSARMATIELQFIRRRD
ncbi:hypothetical protein Ddc_17899 [Ditylenchus destructor]|nr:hypothetical protein Ddc_17899 [Ditylenchus destructor]